MRFKLYAWLSLFFIITQALGILVASTLIEQQVKVSIVSDNPQDPLNALALVLYILVFTGLFLFMMKFFKKRFFKVFESFAVFATSWIVIDSMLPGLGVMFAALIVGLRIAFRENIWLKNLASVFAVAGAGALIGVSLGVIPVLLFISILSLYDIIAVFWTKHMVKMAKAIVSQNLAFTFTIPTKEHAFQLGTGDLVIPLVFGVAVFGAASALPLLAALLPVSMVLFASILGLIATMHLCAEKKIALPALPLQSAYMIAIWAFCFLIGMPVL